MAQQSKQRELKRLRPYLERAKRMRGWTFDVQTTPGGPGAPWDYTARARDLAISAHAVLDMGTGGGELFLKILDGHRGLAVATEGWPPNVPVASQTLSPIGAQVVGAAALHLPFSAGCFDLVLNHHEDLAPEEVARVLVSGGRVLTQQVGRNEWKEIVDYFPATSTENSDDLFQVYQDGFEKAGLNVIQAQEHGTPLAYHSLGDVVYMLAIVMPQWRDHDFDLKRDLDALLALERDLSSETGILLTESRFVIEAKK